MHFKESELTKEVAATANDQDPQKRIKALTKKLRQIRDLEEKGTALSEEEKAKVDKKGLIEAEIKQLETNLSK